MQAPACGGADVVIGNGSSVIIVRARGSASLQTVCVSRNGYAHVLATPACQSQKRAFELKALFPRGIFLPHPHPHC